MQRGFAPILIVLLIGIVAAGIGGAYYLGFDHGFEKSVISESSQYPSTSSEPNPLPTQKNTYDSEITLFSYPDTGSRVIKYGKLDDCLEKIDIYLQDSKDKKLILETSSGCAEYTQPRYVGFTDNNLLIFSLYKDSVDFNKSKPNFEVSTIKELYSLNPLTLEKKLIMDSAIIPKGVSSAEVVDVNRKFITLFDQSNYVTYFYSILDMRFYKSPN